MDVWQWQVRPSDSPLMKKLGQIRATILQRAGGLTQAKTLLDSWYSEDDSGSSGEHGTGVARADSAPDMADSVPLDGPGRTSGGNSGTGVARADSAPRMAVSALLDGPGRTLGGGSGTGVARANSAPCMADSAPLNGAGRTLNGISGTGVARADSAPRMAVSVLPDGQSRRLDGGLRCGRSAHRSLLGIGRTGEPPPEGSDALWCGPPAHHGAHSTGRTSSLHQAAGSGYDTEHNDEPPPCRRRAAAALAYRFFQPRGVAVTWAAAVWRPGIMPKHRFAYWLAAHGKLRTADRMPYEAMKECPLCHSAEESNAHIFFRCSFTRRLWDMVRSWLHIWPQICTMARLFRALRRDLRGKGRIRRARDLAISCMIFLVWQARNRSRFEDHESSVERLFLKIQTHVYRFVEA